MANRKTCTGNLVEFGLSRSSQHKERTCLNCGNLFKSTGPGNRICNPCGKFNPNNPRNKVISFDSPGKGFIDSNY